MFINEESLKQGTWQAFERVVYRLLLHEGFEGIRLVGHTGDQGADLLAHRFGKRWLFQVKHWKSRVGLEVVDRTLEAQRTYKAQVPVLVALSGFDDAVREQQRVLLSRGVPLLALGPTRNAQESCKTSGDLCHNYSFKGIPGRCHSGSHPGV